MQERIKNSSFKELKKLRENFSVSDAPERFKYIKLIDQELKIRGMSEILVVTSEAPSLD